MSKFFKSLLLLLTAGAFVSTGWAAVKTYNWDFTKGFVDDKGNRAVVNGDFTITAKFKMPNVTVMNNSDILVFKATKNGADVGFIGMKNWTGNGNNNHTLTYMMGANKTESSGGHYSSVRLYNGGEGVNTLTVTATNYNAGSVGTTKYKVDFAKSPDTTGEENKCANASFSADNFLITSVSLGEGVTLESATLVVTDRLIARWDNFTGLTAVTPLAPTESAIVNELNGGSWKFNLGGGTVTDGVLATGTTTAPNISFDEFNVGRDGKPITVLVAVQLPLTPTADKPFFHIGNGSTGYGLVSVSSTKVAASWQDSAWKSSDTTKQATFGSLAEELGTVYLVYSVANGSTNASVTSVTLDTASYSWQTFGGLTGPSVNANQITFGNFVTATSGGLNYDLKSVAVFNGAFAPLADVQNVIRAWEGFVTDLEVDARTHTSLSTALDGRLLAPNATLTINFGDKSEENAQPGTFIFDNTDAVSFTQVIVKGTNGGTITKSGTDVMMDDVIITGDTNVEIPETIDCKSVMIDEGATLRAKMLNGKPMVVNGTLESTYNSSTQIQSHNYSKITGTGTLKLVSSGWVYLPGPSQLFASTLALENEVAGGIVFADKTNVYNIGTLSGSGDFRSDMGDGGNATLRVTQRASTTFNGNLMHSTSSNKDRGMKLVVAAEGNNVLTMTASASSNNYQGGVEIEAGATLKITHANALGTGLVSGEGTIQIDHSNGLPNRSVISEDWRGYVVLNGISMDGLRFDRISNSYSTIEIVGNVSNYLGQAVMPNLGVLKLAENAEWAINNGYSTLNDNTTPIVYSFAGLEGKGKLYFSNDKNVTDTYTFTEVDAFGGEIEITGNRRVVLGGDSSIAENGTIVVAKSVTIAPDKIWTAKNGVLVISTGTLSGSGTIGSALTFNADATLDVTAGTLTANDTVSLLSTLKVKLPESLADLEVVPLMTTAFATNVTDKAVSVAIGNGEFNEASYTLKSTENKLLLVKNNIEAIANLAITIPLGAQSQELSAYLPADVPLAENAALTIHFSAPGQTFTFDTATTLGSVTVTAADGVTDGKIAKSDSVTLSIAALDLRADVEMPGMVLRDCIKAQTVNIPEAKTLSISVPDGGTDWDCALNQFFEGAGTLKKIGNGSLNVIPREGNIIFKCEPKILVAEGSVRFASNNQTDYAEQFDITVESDAMLKIGYGAALTNENTMITLKNGATLELKNVNTSSVTKAKIVVDNGAKIQTQQQAAPLKNAFFSGAISGYGTLVFDSNFDLPIEFRGVISDKSASEKLKVQVAKSTGLITFTAANTYTGGTEIAEGVNFTVACAQAIGPGPVTVNGALTVAANTTVSTIAGAGTLSVQSTADLTVKGESYYGGTINVAGKLYLTRAFTLTSGAKLDVKTNGLVGNASTKEALVVTVEDGATLMRNLGVLSANVDLMGGAILDYTEVQGEETSVLDVRGLVKLLASQATPIIVKGLPADYYGAFLGCANGQWTGNEEELFVFTITPSNRFTAGLSGVEIVKASLGFTKVSEKVESEIPEPILDEICGLALGVEWYEINEIKESDIAECFTGYSLVSGVDDKTIVTVFATFGIYDVRVLERTLDQVDESGKPVTGPRVAVAVKATNGAWWEEGEKPAYLRDGTKIHLSTDGGKTWPKSSLKPFDESLQAAGLTAEDGVYWFWAGDLPTIVEGTTSTTHHYKVKAVNTPPQPEESSDVQ